MHYAEQNYLYILFAVLYIIYGVVKAIKKKQPVSVPPSKSTDIEPITASSPKDKYKTSVEKPSLKKSSKPFLEAKREMSNPSKDIDKQQIDSLQPTNSSEENYKNDEGESIDLRKAVIYSEILNRPLY